MTQYEFIIVRPMHHHGGPTVLSALAKMLNELGYKARVFYVPYMPDNKKNGWRFWRDWVRFVYIKHVKGRILWMFLKNSQSARAKWYRDFLYTPFKDEKLKILPFYNKKKTIVVYPEVVYGNFLHATHVVRWLLYHYKYLGDKMAYSPSDIFLCYRNIFNCKELNPEELRVSLCFFNKDLYRQYNYGKRIGKCYVIRKGHWRNDLPSSFDGPIIDYGTSEQEIVRLFNESKYAYFYDTQTFYSTVAFVCGCIPIIILEPGKNRSDYLGENDLGLGKAYGDTPEEIEFAISTREQGLQYLNDINKRNEKNIQCFLQIMNRKFGLKLL